MSHRALLRRCWQLRDNLSMYDAAYVALAEALDTPLLTADARLAKAPGVECAVEVLSARSRAWRRSRRGRFARQSSVQ